jgi:dCMP deaminase
VNWDQYFIDLALTVASHNKSCIRRQFGCVLVRPDHSIISTGYNGAVQGFSSCGSRGECYREYNQIPSGDQLEKCFAIHAEQNALMFAAKHGVSVNGAACYVTGRPCPICLRLLIQSGIKRLVYIGDYPIDWGPYHDLEKMIEVTKIGEV